MSEFRQNIVTQEWVIISPERGHKSEPMKRQEVKNEESLSEYDIGCPFCSGNGEKSQIIETFRINDKTGNWKVRAIENKYKILSNYDTCPTQPGRFENYGIYTKYTGCRLHELVIESRYHNRTIATMTKSEVEDIISVYYNRYIEFGKNPSNFFTVIFKNYGVKAGASQPHAHSQIVASRIVPLSTRNMLSEAQRFFDRKGICVFCEVLEFELKEEKRVIYQNKSFVSIAPYAAGEPHETWILPKTHKSGFNKTTEEERNDFADILNKVLIKFYKALNNADFNYVIYSAPYPLSNVPFFHWYIQIVPRIKNSGGFEIGTRVSVNTVSPEESARILKDCPC